MSAVGKQGPEMVTIEVDGIELQVPRNSMIIEATDRAGITVPRFCYHEKLSIAANCRMCLVDVEKAPKPVPACATPVMDGMKIYTSSRRAMDAQRGVMEFLLINHPLDCPICDQGGECELQDLAMGYGRSVSRFTERKRVVKDKNVGPLIQTDMTRCIHCTRCVRFLEEIAGTSEMGGTGRGDRLEIGTCIEASIDSELSGNIIDLCPVGALTNKPFRYSARAWELVSQPSRALHDGIGSALNFHTRRGDVMRAVPVVQDAVNENWLADRDRYSHFGLYSEHRVLAPMVRKGGELVETSWQEACQAAARALRSAGGNDLGVLMSPSALNEEYFLARRLAAGLECANIDHRLREQDFSDQGGRPSGFQAGLAELEKADAILLVGCNARHEAPILGHRVRQAWRGGGEIMALNPLGWNFHFDLAADILAAPQEMVAELAGLASAVAEAAGTQLPGPLAGAGGEVSDTHRDMARRLVGAERGAVIIGQFAMAHPQASWLRQLSAWLAEASGARLNVLPHGGNTTGAEAFGAIPHGTDGLDARRMLESPRKAYLLWDFEPDFDVSNPTLAREALEAADTVVAVASLADESLRARADVLLPLAPWPESEGSVFNLEGTRFPLRAAGRRNGDSRPGWKILRRLGEELGLDGFDQVSLEEVQAEMPAVGRDTEAPGWRELPPLKETSGMVRAGEVPMYSVDALCRRSDPLQQTVHAKSGFLGLNPADADRLGLSEGGMGRVEQGGGAVELPVRVTGAVPAGAVWVPSGTCSARLLGDAIGAVTVGKGGGGD